jgi:hypothetical protein
VPRPQDELPATLNPSAPTGPQRGTSPPAPRATRRGRS